MHRYGYASNPNRPAPDTKFKDGKFHLYGGNNVAIIHDGISKIGFKAVFTHEMFHNLGYYDVSNGEVPYPDTCMGAILGEDIFMSNSDISRAGKDCFRGDYDRHVDTTASIVSNHAKRLY